jgi:hypothetical protein
MAVRPGARPVLPAHPGAPRMLHFNHLASEVPSKQDVDVWYRWLTAHDEVARLRELISRNSVHWCAQPTRRRYEDAIH